MQHEPVELIIEQITLLPVKEITRLCTVNKHLHRICKHHEQTIYGKLLQRDFNVDNYKSIYKKMQYLYKYYKIQLSDPFVFRNEKWQIDMIHSLTNIDRQDKKGQTPLMLAIEYNSTTKVFEKIFEMNPNINLINDKGETALILILKKRWQSKEKYRRVLHAILSRQPNVNVIDKIGMTALMHAVRNEAITFHDISAIVEMGARLDVKDTIFQWTALEHAIKARKHQDIIKFLLR